MAGSRKHRIDVPEVWRPIVERAKFEGLVKSTLDRAWGRRLGARGLRGYGVGLREVRGEHVPELAAIAYVDTTRAKSAIRGRIEKSVTVGRVAVPTDVQVAGDFAETLGEGLNRKRRRPPIKGGGSIQDLGSTNLMEATYGVKAHDLLSNGEDVMLTAGHALMRIRGSPVIQPARRWGGSIQDTQAFTRRRFIDNTGYNIAGFSLGDWWVDAGLAGDASLDDFIIHVGYLRGVLSPFAVSGLPVAKSGQTTGITHGTIVASYTTWLAPLLSGVKKAHNVMRVLLDVEKGDSGSILVTSAIQPTSILYPALSWLNNYGLGIVVGKFGRYATCCQLRPAMEKLNFRVATR